MGFFLSIFSLTTGGTSFYWLFLEKELLCFWKKSISALHLSHFFMVQYFLEFKATCFLISSFAIVMETLVCLILFQNWYENEFSPKIIWNSKYWGLWYFWWIPWNTKNTYAFFIEIFFNQFLPLNINWLQNLKRLSFWMQNVYHFL